jgi:RimJ/RimL family protein N-acetyltransferase
VIPPVIRTPRLLLADTPAEVARELAYAGPGGWRWLDSGPGEGTREMAGTVARAAEVGWHQPPWGLYVIVRCADGRAIGSIGFHGPPGVDGVVEIGYDLVPDARGCGFATEAAVAATEAAFSDPGVSAVLALTTADNMPSQRVLLRAGFRFVRLDSDGLHRYRVDR